MLFGVLGGLAIYVKLSTVELYTYDRYLTSAVIFACILAARMVGAWTTEHHSIRTLRLAAVVALVSLAAFAVADGIIIHDGANKSYPQQPVPKLGRFLEAHQLHNGLGDYWSSSIVTVDTDRAVTVRPVSSNPSGTIVRYQRQSNSSWYAGKTFQFLV